LFDFKDPSIKKSINIKEEEDKMIASYIEEEEQFALN
jgi:hypothetical protein